MKHLTSITILPFLALSANAGEIRLADCPESVRTTIQQNSRGGQIDEVESHTVEGRQLFIAEIDLPGDKDLKLHVSATGGLLKATEEIAVSELPQPVKSGADAKAAGGRIDDTKKITESGTVTYLVEIDRKAANDLKLVFAADGKLLSETEDFD